MEPLLIVTIILGLVAVGSLVFAFLKGKNKPPTPDLEAQKSEQALQQMLEMMRTNQQELANQRESLQKELARQREGTQKELAQTRDELRNSLGDSQRIIQARLNEANQTVNTRLGQAAKLFTDISKGLGSVSEFSQQLSNLRDVFQSPKLRGNIGEEILKGLLEQVLPQQQYAMQFKFKEGQVVDAIIKTKQGLIPIDSKFPMENFRVLSRAIKENLSEKEVTTIRRTFTKDVKKHIDAIRKKYILPDEGTVDFAVMYVPSEAIYYEIMQNSEELMDFAAEQKVYLVSPNTFYYFLKVIMIGLEGARMEELSQQILGLLKTVQKDTSKFGEELNVLSRHVTNAKNASDRVSGKFERLAGKLDNVNQLESQASATSQRRAELKESIDDIDIPVQQKLN